MCRKMLVNNPELVRVQPLSPRSIQLSALKAGVTQLNVWDDDDNVTSIDLTILGDVAELNATLKTLFPDASLRLRPLNSSLYISGFVPKAEMVQQHHRVAQRLFPEHHQRHDGRRRAKGAAAREGDGSVADQAPHPRLRLGPAQRRQLRHAKASADLLQTPGNLIGNSGATVRFGVVDGGSFYGFLEALRQYDLAKLLAEPTLTTLRAGRPASTSAAKCRFRCSKPWA